LRQLAPHTNNNTGCTFELINVHNSLVAQLFEVQFVGGIEIGGVRLGIVTLIIRISLLFREFHDSNVPRDVRHRECDVQRDAGHPTQEREGHSKNLELT
jgi:hypothetical protein